MPLKSPGAQPRIRGGAHTASDKECCSPCTLQLVLRYPVHGRWPTPGSLSYMMMIRLSSQTNREKHNTSMMTDTNIKFCMMYDMMVYHIIHRAKKKYIVTWRRRENYCRGPCCSHRRASSLLTALLRCGLLTDDDGDNDDDGECCRQGVPSTKKVYLMMMMMMIFLVGKDCPVQDIYVQRMG